MILVSAKNYHVRVLFAFPSQFKFLKSVSAISHASSHLGKSCFRLTEPLPAPLTGLAGVKWMVRKKHSLPKNIFAILLIYLFHWAQRFSWIYFPYDVKVVETFSEQTVHHVLTAGKMFPKEASVSDGKKVVHSSKQEDPHFWVSSD